MEYDLNYPNLNFAHKTDYGPDFHENFEEHYHIVYEMLFLLDGDVEMVIENRKYTMAVGDLAFIQPGQHHHITPNPDTRYERYVIKFPENEIPKELLGVLKEKANCSSVVTTVIPQLFERMDWHYKSYTGEYLQCLMESVLKEIITYFCCKGSSEKNTVYFSKKMAEVVDYINENISRPLTISDICDHFHYSKSYICKEFLRCMDVPIIQYVRTKKILLADSLIKEGVKPTLAYKECGFSDYSTFFRAYRKIIGKPPSDSDEE